MTIHDIEKAKRILRMKRKRREWWDKYNPYIFWTLVTLLVGFYYWAT